jgi:hypothetical protein
MRRLLAFLFLPFAVATAAGQDLGQIECQGQTLIPAWTAPGSAYLVDQLSDGQMVSVSGLDRGYVRIQIGERVAYVDAKYVRFPPSQTDQEGRIAALEAQTKSMGRDLDRRHRPEIGRRCLLPRSRMFSLLRKNLRGRLRLTSG